MATAGRTFRVFVSSTFADLKAERNALQRYVFPRLRDLCVREGFRFQAIDLRWGVRDEAALDQKTMEICLDEVARCQRTSPRPNFIILLGDRYGWRPLPPQIPADEMGELARCLVDPQDAGLVERWYRRDDNSVPSVYVLQPRSVVVPDGVDAEAARAAREAEGTAWRTTEAELQRILRSAAAAAGFSDTRMEKYRASATEQEITRGAMRPAGAEQHVFAFVRTIEGSAELLDSPSAADYVDAIDHAGRVAIDEEAHRLLADLRDIRLPARLGPHVSRYSARWTGDGVTTEHLGRLPDTLDECLPAGATGGPPSLCADVWRSLSSVILAEIADMKAVDPLDGEIAEHRAFGADRRRFFAGRASLLAAADEYLRSDRRTPFAVIGPSGSGKSALLAQIAHHAERAIPVERVITRFIGATPDSTSARSLLEGLCEQISRTTPAPEERGVTPERTQDERSLQDLARRFASLLQQASSAVPMVIVLDALDQLSDADNARRLLWLPDALPANVKIVVSVLPGDGASALERRLPADARVEVEPMTADEGGALLDAWLCDAGRTLQPAQRRAVLDAFAREGRPLYLKLAFEDARQWPSYADPASVHLGADIDGLLRDLFARLALDANHGPTLVSRSLGYLAAAKNGLSEDELLDVLSRDEDVFGDFISRARHEPPERRLPVIVWSRLYFDLEPYLVERSADGATLLSFYHRQFADAVRDRFLAGEAGARRHEGLARYFGGQPLHTETGRQPSANLRKLSELPFQQTFAGLWDDLRSTLADFDFLQAKVESNLLYDAIDDFENLSKAFPEPAHRYDDTHKDLRALLAAFSSAFNQEFHAFAALPHITAQQLFSNLFVHDGFGGPAGPILERFRARHSYPGGWSWLRRVNRAPRTSTSRALRRTIVAHDGPVTALAVSPDGDLVATGAADGSVRVWQARDGSQQGSVAAHAGEVTVIRWIARGTSSIVASGGRDGYLHVWDWKTEQQLVRWRAHLDRVRGLFAFGDGERVASCGDDRLVKIWHWPSAAENRVLRGHKDRVFCVTGDPSGSVLLSGGEDRTLKLWNLATPGEPRTIRGHDTAVRAVAIAPGARCAASGADDGCLKTWDAEDGRERRSVAAHRRRISAIAMTRDGAEIATAGEDGTVKLWDTETAQLKHTLRGHAGAVQAVAYHPEARWIASGGEDGTLRFWNVQEQARAHDDTFEHDAAVACLHRSETGGMVVTGGEDCTIAIWDEHDGTHRVTLRGHLGPVQAVVSLDGTTLVSGGGDRSVKVWDVSTARLLRTLGNQLTGMGTALSAAVRGATSGHASAVTCLARVDRQIVASGSRDGTLRLWDAGREEELRVLSGGGAPIECVALARGGRAAVTAGTSRDIAVWDLDTGEIEVWLKGHEGNVTCLACGGDGTDVISGSLDRTVRSWPLAGGEPVVLRGHEERVNAVAVDPGTGVILSAGHDATIRVWDATRSQPLRVLRAHRGPVRCLAIDAAGRVISGGDDGFIVLWDIATGHPVARIHVGSPVVCAAALRDDRICAGLKNGGVAFVGFEPGVVDDTRHS